MPNQQTSGSTKASDVLVAIKARLLNGLNDDPVGAPIDETFIRIMGRADMSYRPEKGVFLRFSSPEPNPNAGANRWGLLTKRTLEVHLITQNLSDPAQHDEKAVIAHLDFEEKVVNVLHDASPVGTPQKIAVTVRWIPGGAVIERQMKVDAGVLASVILFEVQYQAAMIVNTDTPNMSQVPRFTR